MNDRNKLPQGRQLVSFYLLNVEKLYLDLDTGITLANSLTLERLIDPIDRETLRQIINKNGESSCESVSTFDAGIASRLGASQLPESTATIWWTHSDLVKQSLETVAKMLNTIVTESRASLESPIINSFVLDTIAY